MQRFLPLQEILKAPEAKILLKIQLYKVDVLFSLVSEVYS